MNQPSSRHFESSLAVIFLAGLFAFFTFTAANAALPDSVDGEPLPSLAPLVKRVAPAVVNIRVSQTVDSSSVYGDEMFRRFFGIPENSERGSREVASAGSGVIVDAANGYILTNHHVVEGADEIQVSLFNEDSLDAEVVGSDAGTDIALIKVDPKSLTELAIGDSNAVEVGDFVIAIGNPFGLGHTVTSGIVSALGRSGISRGGYEDFIQTDASINPGNSGGALVNMRGELVGINSAIISGTGGNVGIGFAVPSEIAQSIMRQILDFGEVRRGLLGVTIQTMDAESAEALGTEIDRGALITGIEPGSAAEKAGLQVDDIITGVNDERIDDNRELANAIGLKGSGEEVRIQYVREGRSGSVVAELGQQAAQSLRGELIHPRLEGAMFPRASTNSTDGVEVLSVEPDSPAAQRDLRAGDIIIQANRREVSNLNELQQVAAGSRILFLLVQRGDRQLMLQIR